MKAQEKEWRRTAEQITAGIEAAIAAGTHSRTMLRYCQGCGKETDVIFYGTVDRRDLCPACADKLGVGPESIARRRAQFSQGRR